MFSILISLWAMESPCRNMSALAMDLNIFLISS